MIRVRSILLALCLVAAGSLVAAESAQGAFVSGKQRNLFAELLGKSEAQLDAKIDAAWRQIFYGNNESERIYFPVGDDMAYMADIGSNDVRSEGMSYGMMLAVQMDKRAEFDRLWRWAKKYMYHADGPRRGYFAWHCSFEGRQLDPGSASDGEEWFATALFFAAHRWGTGGAYRADATVGHPPGEPRLGGDASPYQNASPIDYEADAQALLRAMLHKPTKEGIPSIFDRERKQVVFAPTLEGMRFTDPSYHVPAFYELWARWAADESDRAFWAETARTSRELFRRAAHPKTGLMPDYSHFDGRPYADFGANHADFRYDARRTIANVALDHAWFAADAWQVEQSNRVLRFLASHGAKCPSLFTVEGKPLTKDTSIGLVAMAAVGGLAADADVAQPFVQQLWNARIPTGQWRYYDGVLYFFGLLQAGGRFQIYGPVATAK